MLITKKLAQNISIKNKNINKMKNMLAIIVTKMQKQGKGCFSPETGVLYFNHENNTLDPIGHLLSVSDVKRSFGAISDDSSKNLVNKIVAKYQVNVDRECERVKFVEFLQDLQDAHDYIFDGFSNKDVPEQNRMPMFLGNCNQIAFKYGIV